MGKRRAKRAPCPKRAPDVWRYCIINNSVVALLSNSQMGVLNIGWKRETHVQTGELKKLFFTLFLRC